MFPHGRAIAFVVVCACAPAAVPAPSIAPTPAPIPINVSNRVLDTLVFAGIDVTPLVGSQIGFHHDGLLKIRQYPIAAQYQELQTLASVFREVGQGLMRSSGYPIVVPAQLFGRYEQYGAARFVLAGRATRMEYNSYGALAGNSHTVGLQVAWELFDSQSRRVVFARSYTGTASGRRDSALAGTVFRDLVSRLLADEEFVTALTFSSNPAGATVHLPEENWRRAMPGEAELIRITAHDKNPSTKATVFDRVADAVITLESERGGGTAFLITKDGLAMTNHHVVEGQTRLVARMRDGKRYAVRVIRVDKASDVALVEVACEEDCYTLDVYGAPPEVGVEVYVIGTPLSEALARTVTRGIVSGLRRSGSVTVVQTDAAVNPGNSGGPLVLSESGRVLGIVSAKIVEASVEGIGFAIAIPDALRVVGIQH